MSAEQRRTWCKDHLSSAAVFHAGLVMMAALLLNPSTELRGVQFLLFWFYAWLCGRKNNALITLTVMFGIVAFNLISPFGKVLAEWGAFRLTQGALLAGLRKAFTLEALLLLSKASIRPDLRLPGAFGSLLADCFSVFERISEQSAFAKPRRRPAAPTLNPRLQVLSLIEKIDSLLLELSEEEKVSDTISPQQKVSDTAPLNKKCLTPFLSSTLIPFIAALLPLAITIYACIESREPCYSYIALEAIYEDHQSRIRVKR
jgi:hypothetical protein